MASNPLTVPAPVAPCPKCERTAQLAPEYRTAPAFIWTDGWIERRDGSPVPPGWVECPHCHSIETHAAWERRSQIGTWEDRLPPTQEPSAEALRAHLVKLLEAHLDPQRAHELRLQLWWLANARRRGSDSAVPLAEAESRELFRLLRPPDAPGLEGGFRRIEALRELGQLEQAKKAIVDARARLDRLEALVDQGDTSPRLWNPNQPIKWPPEASGVLKNAETL